ncbi:single myb histone 6-like [Miscanthus floridulus]|uniref:single myb histone 6-like n=1 Tax=Miscanthus floridulus TaxID=154761 RepID=UPI00345A8B28
MSPSPSPYHPTPVELQQEAAMAARERRTEQAQLNRSRAGARCVLKGLRFISRTTGSVEAAELWRRVEERFNDLAREGCSPAATSANASEQYWSPSDFDHLLSAKLKDLATSGKLLKKLHVLKLKNLELFSMTSGSLQVNWKYRIAPSSPRLEGRSPKMMLLEDVQGEPLKLGSDASRRLTRSQVDAELVRMATMTAEAAAAAAAHAVAEAEAIMAEAEAAAREAEAAEAEARAAQAFAEAAVLTLKNRNAAKLV